MRNTEKAAAKKSHTPIQLQNVPEIYQILGIFLTWFFFAQPVLVGHGMITKVERHVRHNLSPTAYPPDTSTFVGLLLQLPPQWNFKNGSIALRIKLNHYFNCCTTCPTFHISVSWNNCYCWLVGMGELCSDVNLFASLVFQPWHPTHCWLPFLL